MLLHTRAMPLGHSEVKPLPAREWFEIPVAIGKECVKGRICISWEGEDTGHQTGAGDK